MKRFCAMALAIIMVIAMLPMQVFAANMSEQYENANFTVIADDQSTLAPGVTLNEVVAYNKNNQRVEMYVTTVDLSVETVQVKANYMDNQNDVFGLQALSDQVAAMEANYPEPFKIVAGINASYYNTTTGQPNGAFVMEGKDVSANGDGFAFFAVLKDGTYMIGAKGEYSKYKGQIQEAIGGQQHIVKDGKVVSGLDKTTLYPRQTLGLTADGKLILMTADGSQAPATVGTTVQEQAEIMLALGCVEAIHLDGGNSATFGVVPEGEDKFVTKNSPSGYSERRVSNTLMIISTAVADGTFDHAIVVGDYDYYAPYSEYEFTAFGVDATNSAAEIPESAVWALSDDSFGTISDGLFVSNGKQGKVDVQLIDNGIVVGSKSIEIVNPTTASFALEETAVPYGKTAELKMTALYGNFAIYTDANHYTLDVNPATAGSMDGFQFTAANDESVKEAVVTGTYQYANGISDSITVKFGKGSEILFDFEDGDITDWRGTEEFKEWREEYNANNPPYQLYDPDDYSNGIGNQYSEVFLATRENGGKVKNGDYALGFRMNHKNVTDVGGWLYNYLYYTGETKVLRDVANGQTAVRIGMWVYSPDITNVAFRIVRGTDTNGKTGISYKYMVSDYDGKSVSYATNYAIPESGWIYIYYDLTDLKDNVVQTTSKPGATLTGTNANADYYPAFLQLFTGSAFDSMEDMIFYIDDITLDYGDVTEDRDAPVISDVSVCSDGSNDVPLNGQTVDNNQLSFTAKVSDVSGNANATGLNYDSAKIYVDGIDVSGHAGFKAGNGMITLNNVYLTNGKHNVAFVIFDNQGNETRVTKSLTVNGSADNAVVSLVGRNEGNHTPKAGSVYYIDVKVSDASKVSEAVTTLKLNTPNTFEYEHIVCAEGVTAETSYDAKNFEVTVKLTHDGSLTGEAVLASIPVRVWAWDEAATGVSADQQFATTAIPTIDLECKSLYGSVVYTGSAYSDYICGFSGSFDIRTELDNKTAWHKHSAAAIADQEATCKKDGYTGRTYCEGCASVIDWGTTVPAGHNYGVVNGKLACVCGDELKVNGLVTLDGKTYYGLAGKLLNGWQYVTTDNEATTGYYYFDKADYAAVDGDLTIDGYDYKFVDKLLVRGSLVRNGDFIRYMWAGDWVFNGWVTIDGEKYYFSTNYAMTGPSTIRSEEGVFAFTEDGVWLEGRTGLLDFYGRQYYYENGMCKGAGLVQIGDDYYFIGPDYQPVTGKCWVGKPNTAITGMTEGEYEFGEDGKMIRKIEKNGPVGDYFYIDGVRQNAYQLVEFEGDYYFISDSHKLAKNCTVYLSEKFVDGTGIPVGKYSFDADGKMIILNGPVGDYFYINGVLQKCYQLVEFEGSYYFINDGNKLAKNSAMYLTEKFVAGTNLTPGVYNFDADGKMIILNGPVGDYFYINGILQKAYQLVEFEGYYYFINDGHKLAKNCSMYLTEKFVAGTTLVPGVYNFDADGKMIILNGPVGDYFYINGVLQKCYQLVEFEGSYYFINDGHKLAKNCAMYLTEKFVAGTTLTPGVYNFDADGKMIILNGPVGDYFYINGIRQKAYQLVEFEGSYYFIDDGNKIARNCRRYLVDSYVSKHRLPTGNYYFDADGKMILKNGPEGDYFYINGIRQNAYQLLEFEGGYYFVADSHKLAKNCTVYLSNAFVYGTGLEAGYYSFDANGRMMID